MREIFKTPSPVLGFNTLCFGADAQTLDENLKRYSCYVKLVGPEPEMRGEEFKIFTFGLFMVKQHNRVRAGFVKRHQTLLKA